MKARLLVLVVALACAAGGAVSHLTPWHGHGGRPAVTSALAPVGEPIDAAETTSGWWDWHKSDL
jgi:hypothetical protein